MSGRRGLTFQHLDANRVGAGIYVGGFPQHRDGRVDVRALPEIARDFDLVVLMAKEWAEDPMAMHLLRSAGPPVVGHGIEDDYDRLTASEQHSVLRGAFALRTLSEHGCRGLVLCNQGRNRSAVTAATALVMLGERPDTAIRHVREGRQRRGLHVLENPAYTGWLRVRLPTIWSHFKARKKWPDLHVFHADDEE